MRALEPVDVAVVGGGLVGAAAAERLARDGLRVALVERGRIGREASWAAAGLLCPIHPWRYPEPLLELDRESLALWPGLAERLRAETGVDVEFRATELLALLESEEDEREAGARVAWKRARGEPAERLGAEEARRLEPALARDVRGALLLGGLAQVRNHRVAPALAAAAARRGAVVLEDVLVLGLRTAGERVTGLRTTAGDLSAGTVVLAAGAWSGALLPDHARPAAALTVPARGQIVLLRAAPGTLRRMVLGSGEYVVPRDDGRVLAGSTVEYVGFDRRATAAGVAAVTAAALRLCPALADAEVEAAWGGLRPDTPDHLPVLGPVCPGLVAATGHFRSGIMLAPVTAEIVAALVRGESGRDLAPFAPDRAG